MTIPRLFYVQLRCEDYDPYFQSTSFLVVGGTREEVYHYYRKQYEEDFDLFDRRLYVDEEFSIGKYNERALCYLVTVEPWTENLSPLQERFFWTQWGEKTKDGTVYWRKGYAEMGWEGDTVSDVEAYRKSVYPHPKEFQQETVVLEVQPLIRIPHYLNAEKKFRIRLDEEE